MRYGAGFFLNNIRATSSEAETDAGWIHAVARPGSRLRIHLSQPVSDDSHHLFATRILAGNLAAASRPAIAATSRRSPRGRRSVQAQPA